MGIVCVNSLPSFMNMSRLALPPPTLLSISQTIACKQLVAPSPRPRSGSGFWNVITPSLASKSQAPNFSEREFYIYKE